MRYSILLLLLIAGLFQGFAQRFSPEIDNYTFGDNQNWDIHVDAQGLVLVANNEGLIVFNGQQSELLELPGQTIIRSVFPDDERIYTGSYEEFGFWKRDDYGEYQYTSLTALIRPSEDINSEEFWQILKFQDQIIFRSFGGVYIYDGTRIEKVAQSDGVSAMTVFGNRLLVDHPQGGFAAVVDSELVILPEFEAYAQQQISQLASFEDQLFFYVESGSAVIYDGDVFSALPSSINTLLLREVLNKVSFIDRDYLAFGTIKQGLMFYQLRTQETQFINKESGLNNNTVLGIHYSQGNLWAALDNGFSKVDLDSPFRYYFDLSGDLGTVYDIAYYNKAYYLASNTGIYSFNEADELQLIQNSEGHVWNLQILDGRLFAGHNNGTYEIDQSRILPRDITSGGVYQFVPIPDLRNTYLLCTYSGIFKMHLGALIPQISKVTGVDFPINDIIFADDRTIWATHPYKGLYRLTLDEDYTQILEREDFTEHPQLTQYRTTILEANQKVLFNNSEEWLRFDEKAEENDNFIPLPQLAKMKSIGREEEGFWFFKSAGAPSIFLLDDQFNEKYQISDVELMEHMVVNYEKIIAQNDSIRLVNLNDGFAYFNINNLAESVTKAPRIHKFYSPSSSYPVVQESYEIPFRQSRSLTLEVYTPETFGNTLTYHLTGEEEQQEAVQDGLIQLRNLDYGDYLLKIYNARPGGSEGEEKQIALTILPPWYYSAFAKASYVVLILLLLFFVYRINRKKVKQELAQLKRQYTRETQKKIFELEKSNLEREIGNKKKELTNSVASIIKKNETIIQLRNELERLKEVSTNPYRTKMILASSKKTIHNQKDWSQFELNFRQINADFFDNLVAVHPKISTRDLKLCAYIKTGLTSKEIAPLMGISVRGVELRRYRLRKKLGMNAEESFQDYFQSF
ncbi:hypothetical protein [Croceiramulus getboli]|nr:hypothetical protein P8624_09610 [Flavobacteriaceae bacterium YJPT1-3]